MAGRVNKNLIPVSSLAKMINIHRATMGTWLCHYTLGKYLIESTTEAGDKLLLFKFNKSSILALRNYLQTKKRKYLRDFDASCSEYFYS